MLSILFPGWPSRCSRPPQKQALKGSTSPIAHGQKGQNQRLLPREDPGDEEGKTEPWGILMLHTVWPNQKP